MFRHLIATALAASILAPAAAGAQQNLPRIPSAHEIMRSLDAAPRRHVAPAQRVTVREFARRPDLRRAAPSIEIQTINFAFGSAEIPYSQFKNVSRIADAIAAMTRTRGARILIEGHTDAVGSDHANLMLSQHRAASLKRVLVEEFGIPSRAIETAGYGEDFLLVPTPYEDWRNRRVTLRRIDSFVR